MKFNGGGNSAGGGSRRARRLRLERLDARILLYAPTPPELFPIGEEPAELASAPPATMETQPNGLPILNSFPEASVGIYLDFDGYGSNLPYDRDGDPDTFDADEQANIYEGWYRLAMHLAPFDANVTTVVPEVPYSWSVVSNSISGGFSYLRFNGSSPGSYNASGDLVGRTTGILHEIGHNFGLGHQAEFDLLGNKTREYRGALDKLHGPLMGVDYAGIVPKWYVNHPSSGADRMQDDIARIAAKIVAHQDPPGDGFRVDDFADTIAAAGPLPIDGQVQTTLGIIERWDDRDVFSFTADGRTVVAVDRVSMSGVDLKLDVFDAAGTLLGSSDTDILAQQLDLTLVAGTYFVAVAGHGDYSDVGTYSLTVRPQMMPEAWLDRDIGILARGGFAAYEPADGTFTVGGGGDNIAGTSDEFRYVYQTLNGDSTIVARVASVERTNASSKAGVMIRQSLDDDSAHAAMLATPERGTLLRWRETTGGSTDSSSRTDDDFEPVWLKLERAGDTLSGFTSLDGVDWSLAETATIAMDTTVFVGLAVTASSNSKVNASSFDSVTISGDLGLPEPTPGTLPAPTGVAAVAADSSTISLSWDAVPGAVEYAIERSDDGQHFAPRAVVDAGQTVFDDSGLSGHTRLFYRARATDATGVSVPSSVVHATTRPEPVTHFEITSLSTSVLVLNWHDVGGDAGYRVERSDDGLTFAALDTVERNVPSYTDRDLQPGTEYFYRVITLDASGDAATSGTASRFTRITEVTGLAFATVAADQLALQWDDVAGETEYLVQRSTDGADFVEVATLPADSTGYTDTDVLPLGEYYYRVIAVNDGLPGVAADAIFTATPDVDPLPDGWSLDDVGTVTGNGAAGAESGVFTIIGGGTDLEGGHDSVTYLHRDFVGDGTFVARVVTNEDTHARSATGLMFRESLDADSAHFTVAVEPDSDVRRTYRTAAGGSAQDTKTAGDAPIWLRIDRAGNTFQAFMSPDGGVWTEVGGPVIVPMSHSARVGMTSLANDDELLHAGVVDNVSFDAPMPRAVDDAYQLAEDSSLLAMATVEAVVPFAGQWKYLDDGSDQDSAWREAGFDDALWPSGPGPLGYGDSGMGTFISPTDTSGQTLITAYFRTTFDVLRLETAVSLTVDLVRDDGAAVYLNGVELVRSNLPNDAAFDTFALDGMTGNDETEIHSFTFDLADLPEGLLLDTGNVLAAEVHQQSDTSADVRFDLRLQVHRDTAPSVWANDLNRTAQGVAVELVEPSAHGTAQFDAAGTLTYTPDADYYGPDAFTYRLTTGTATILAAGSRWRFDDAGADPGADWTDVGFDDSAWDEGPAQLGYGDGDEQTVLEFGPDPDGKFAAYYFRRAVTLPDSVTASELTIRLLRDDAAAVFLDSQEVYRDDNLAGDAAFDTYATSTVGSEGQFIDIPLADLSLESGIHQLAVEVHQGSPGSSDVSFDLELLGRLTSAPGNVALTITPVDDRPVAVDDAFDALNDRPLAVDAPYGVLANDTRLEGDPIAVLLGAGPEHGALDVVPDGSFVYTPEAGFVGSDSFTYRLSDGQFVDLIARGSQWTYWDDTADPGAGWNDGTFDDSAWDSGSAQLGYGDGDEQTLIDGGVTGQRPATALFRHAFDVPDPAATGDLMLWLLRDDAAAVYLNGVAVHRDTNLAADATLDDFALDTGPENGEITVPVDAELLVSGTNVVAVEVHQASAISTDLSFDLELSGLALSNEAVVSVNVSEPVTTVVARHVYYRGSAFDSGGPEGAAAAVAGDKEALLPGRSAAPENYTSYDRGINGIIIDVEHLSPSARIGDFQLHVGVGLDAGNWTAVQHTDASLTTGGGVGGSDRVRIELADRQVTNAWLRVTVVAGSGTGLSEPDVFYFGNAVGEVTAAGNNTLGAGFSNPSLVNAADVVAIRDNPRGPGNPAASQDPFDVNRDRHVDALDIVLARDNATSPLAALPLTTAPPVVAPPPDGESEGPFRANSGIRESAVGMAARSRLVGVESTDRLLDALFRESTSHGRHEDLYGTRRVDRRFAGARTGSIGGKGVGSSDTASTLDYWRQFIYTTDLEDR